MKEVAFLVSWIVVTIVPFVEKPTTNEYGISSSYSTQSQLAIYRFSRDTTHMNKVFKTEKEANEFIANAPKDSTSITIGSQYCSSFKKVKRINIYTDYKEKK